MEKANEGPVFYRGVYIDAPAEKVWEALTTPEIINQYYLRPIHTLELKKGGKILYGEDGKNIRISGEILEIEEMKKLAHSFSFTSLSDPPTRVTYEIGEMGEMALLIWTHDQFPAENKSYQNISYGWDVILSNLKTLLETGKVLPWPKE